MTEDEYRALDKQQGSLIEDCGYCVPRGVVVACDMATLFKLQTHAKKYYSSMTVIPMTVAECISHMNKPHRTMGDYMFKIKED